MEEMRKRNIYNIIYLSHSTSDLIYETTARKAKNHMVISLNAEKAFDDIQTHSFKKSEQIR